LWIMTRIATRYHGSIENLHIPLSISKLSFSMCGFKLNHQPPQSLTQLRDAVSHKKKSFSNVKYPEVTSNMVDLCTSSSNSKGKQPVVCSSESNDESSSGLKEILSESEEVY